MGFRKREAIELKSADELATMRAAGLVVAKTLEQIRTSVAAGMTTLDIDVIARDMLSTLGATSNFLGYHGFPAVICVSVNEEVVHGIPGTRVLREGDLVSVDFGAVVDGWHGDAAISVGVGDVAAEVRALSEATEASMWAGMRQARVGGRLTDISYAVEQSLRAATPRESAFGIVEDYGGHGIGSSMHMAPHVLNYGAAGKGPRLEAGMALAIEPMATLGDPEVGVLADNWTVVTMDQRPAAHWEHTVAITDDGPWVLTALDDTRL